MIDIDPNAAKPSLGVVNGSDPGDRLPPQNIEVEQSVLGSLLLDNEMLHDVIPLLAPEDFYRVSHQVVYRAIRDLYEAASPVDGLILANELQNRGEFEAIGGHDAIRTIAESPPHAANAVYHAKIVRQLSVMRQLNEISHLTIVDVYARKYTSAELLEAAERRIFALAEGQSVGGTVEIKDVIIEAMDRIKERSEDPHGVTGLATGYSDLDEITGGLQPAQLIILAGRPSMGKTALALNLCEHVICEEPKPGEKAKAVLFVSLEMGELELVERLLSSRAKVDGHKLRTGKHLAKDDHFDLQRAYEELKTARLFIDSTPVRTMLQITANARRLKLRQDLGLIVVDYIQLVEAEESRDSRQEQIAKISRRLKQLARELKVPVVALSQLNRDLEKREDRRPRMSDLRESGAIEQDADLVMLLHRPEYYDAKDRPGVAELILAKNRSGATGKIDLQFSKKLTRFESLAQNIEPVGGDF